MECFKCKISDEKTRLFDVITKEGIIKLCDKCSRQEDSPVIRKPTTFQLKEIERKPTVYEMLSKMAGIRPGEKTTEKPETLIKEETNLRALVDKNYQEKVKETAKPRTDLMDNFHWIIMRVRRARKLTRKQFAEKIGEAEAAIKMAEEGVLPSDNNKLLNKIQNYLKIDLSKSGNKSMQNSSWNIPVNAPAREPLKELDFDRRSSDVLTISDLRRMSIRKDEKENKEEKKDNNKELSDEDVYKLIFKK